MYTTINFRTKKELKEAVKSGKKITIFNPGLGQPTVNGRTTLSGPHYPEAHKWYAEVEMKDGLVIKVVS